jgi:uncharacterized Rossmann fold enzyme
MRTSAAAYLALALSAQRVVLRGFTVWRMCIAAPQGVG